MSGDSYQATYDAVRSRISPCNPGQIIADALAGAFDISHARAMIQQDIGIAINDVAAAMTRPSVLFRPRLFFTGKEGNGYWSARYGDGSTDEHDGVGATPEAAMADFDKSWVSK